MTDLNVTLPAILYFVVFSSKTAFFKLQDIFPECFLYREASPQIEPLVCLQENNACTVGKSCMETLCKRLYVLFQEVCAGCDLIILYYKKRNYDGIGAGVFWSNLEQVRVINVNPFAWARIKRHGNIYQFDPSQEFFLTGQAAPPNKIKNFEDQMLD